VIKKKQLEKELDGKLRHVFNLINIKGRRKITSEMLMGYLKSIKVNITKDHSDRLCELISSAEKKEFTESEFIRFLMPLCRPPP
jgi:Ca2+-binding EF-hand superfamily protein